jgi:cytolysin-activating lysine-acyltransferase
VGAAVLQRRALGTGAGVSAASSGPAPGTPVTVSHVFGELTWLVTQSARHAAFRASDLAWLLMPPIMARQFHIFRDGARPVGAALWAYPPQAAAGRLAQATLSPHNPLAAEEWTGGQDLWLVELVAPFATGENRQIELMLADLMTGPFKGKPFRMLRIDPVTGAGSAALIDKDAGRLLVGEIAAALGRKAPT